MPEFIEPVMKWIVAPLAAIVVWLLKKATDLDKDLRILEAKLDAQTRNSRENHDALRDSMAQVLSRLDSIDQYLRNGKGN